MKRSPIATLLLVTGLTCPDRIARLPAADASSPGQSLAYLIEPEGQVTKLDLGGARVLFREFVPAAPGDDSLRPEGRPGVEAAALDEAEPALFIVRADSTWSEERPAVPYRVIRLTLPGLAPTAEFPVPRPQARAPSLLADPYRGRLLVHWEEAPLLGDSDKVIEWRYVVSALSLPALGELRRWAAVRDTDVSGQVPFPWFHHGPWRALTPEAEVGPDSSRIVHPHGTLYFTRDSFAGRYDRLTVTPELEATIRRGLGLDPRQGRTSFGYPMPVDARGGRVLWKSWSDSTAPRKDVLLTSRGTATTPDAVWSVPWSHAWLLPGGQIVVTQELEGPPGAGTSSIRRSGRLAWFDAGSGAPLGRAELPEIAGAFERARFLCADHEGRFLVFRGDRGPVFIAERREDTMRARPVRPAVVASLGVGCFESSR